MAPKTKKTAYQRQQEAAIATQDMLRRMMSLTEEDMFTLIEGYGMQYLEEQCRHDQAGIDTLKVQSFYWNWWKQNWYQRDAEFVALHGLQNGEDTEREYEFAVNEKGELTAMTLYGAYRYYHLVAMNHEDLCRSYCHIMTAMQKTWRKQVFNQ